MLSTTRLLGALQRAEETLRKLGLASAHSIGQCIHNVAQGTVHPAPTLTVYCPDVVTVTVETELVRLAPGEDRIQAQLREAEGARALMLEIIRRAAQDWVLYRNSAEPDKKLLADEAYVWLFVECEGHPNYVLRRAEHREFTGFLAICEALDMDPVRVRAYVTQLTPDKVLSGRLPRAAQSSKPSRSRLAKKQRSSFDESSFNDDMDDEECLNTELSPPRGRPRKR